MPHFARPPFLGRTLSPKPARRRLRPAYDPLESRRVLSATAAADTVITPSVTALEATVEAAASPGPPSTAISPSQLASAYGFSLSSSSGAGVTIAVVAAYHNPTIQSDLAAFNTYYGLAAANLTVVNQYGQTGGLPATNTGWALESAMDVEWAHAAAPGARIVLVEANSSSITDLMTAVQTASRLGSVVSMSWGGSEWSGETTYDSSAYFGKANVTFVAATGDDGAAAGAQWPSVSPNVVAVGGTTLSVSSGTETAWSASGGRRNASGSTGGASRYESVPSYQSSYGVNSSRRVTPDVASDANPSTGLAVYSRTASSTGWLQIGGTSAGAPVWAGIIAAADAARAASGLSALSSAQTLSLLYSLGKTAPSTYFHDITSGSNYAGYATKGYDVVTGLGSPIASRIIAAASGRSVNSAAVAAAVTTTTVQAVTTGQLTLRAAAVVASAASGSAALTAPTAVAIAPAFGSTAVATPTSLVSAPATNLGVFTTVATSLPAQAVTTPLASTDWNTDDEVLPPSAATPLPLPGPGDFDTPTFEEPVEVLPAWMPPWSQGMGLYLDDLSGYPAATAVPVSAATDGFGAAVSRAVLDGAPAAVLDTGGAEYGRVAAVVAVAATVSWAAWELRRRPEASASEPDRTPLRFTPTVRWERPFSRLV